MGTEDYQTIIVPVVKNSESEKYFINHDTDPCQEITIPVPKPDQKLEDPQYHVSQGPICLYPLMRVRGGLLKRVGVNN